MPKYRQTFIVTIDTDKPIKQTLIARFLRTHLLKKPIWFTAMLGQRVYVTISRIRVTHTP